jgi:hypothetical protein
MSDTVKGSSVGSPVELCLMKTNLEERPLLYNDDELPPTYEEAISDSLREHQVPPRFDFSVIPQQSVLYCEDAVLVDQQSTAKYEIKNGKIKTFDSRLEENADEVWKFFLTHIAPPRLFIVMHGYHTETRSETYTDSDGNSQTRTKEVDVTDFLFKLDCSQYVQRWTRMAAEPRRNHRPLTIKETIDEFAQCQKSIKEIQMRKQVMWDLNELESALRYCIRNTGYSSEIAIKFDMEGADVEVYSSDQWNRMAHDTCCNVLCVLSCLWILFLPLYHLNSNSI